MLGSKQPVGIDIYDIMICFHVVTLLVLIAGPFHSCCCFFVVKVHNVPLDTVVLHSFHLCTNKRKEMDMGLTHYRAYIHAGQLNSTR